MDKLNTYTCESKTVKNVYIATKMRGGTTDEIKLKLHKIADAVIGHHDVNFINFLGDESIGKEPVWCLGESIKRLADADIVIIEKYEEARGVSCEEYICDKYKIPYIKVFLEPERIAAENERIPA